jgi:dimethylaniline monooxygenase (N-oxide forming)
MAAGRLAKRVCVIGAGMAGLAATKVLREDGFDVTAFEREPAIGGVWIASRTYPDLRANISGEAYAFTDHPFEVNDDYPSAPQIRAYLDSYADRFGLRRLIRLATEVIKVRHARSQSGEISGFEVTVRPADDPGSPQTLSFDFVVICNGIFSIPRIPVIEGRSDFAGQVFHSSEIGNFEFPTGKRVVVVGAGKSALDCAALAARRGALTSLIFRRPHWMLPRFFFSRIRADKLMMTRFSELFSKYHRMTRAEAFLHGPGRLLVHLWWLQSETLIRMHLGLPAAFRPTHSLRADFANVGAGGEFYDLLRRGQVIARRSNVSRFTRAGLELSTGEQLSADIVIFATGWEQSVPFLAPELRDAVQKHGRLKLYRFILPPHEQRLGFIGYVASIACQFTSELGAHWLSQVFRGEMKLPSTPEMDAEIARVEHWTAQVVPDRELGYFVLPCMAHYADELLCDMGIAIRRKGNVFAEFLAPFWPARYATLAAERRQARKHDAAD